MKSENSRLNITNNEEKVNRTELKIDGLDLESGGTELG